MRIVWIILIILFTGCASSYPLMYDSERGRKEAQYKRKNYWKVKREQMVKFDNTFNRGGNKKNTKK